MALTYDIQEKLSSRPELADTFYAYSQTNEIPQELHLTGLDIVRGDNLSSVHPTNMPDNEDMAVHKTQSDDMSNEMEVGQSEQESEQESEIFSKTRQGDDEVDLLLSQFPINSESYRLVWAIHPHPRAHLK